MKKNTILLSAAALLLIVGCAREANTGKNDASKRAFDAWVKVQQNKHPEYLWRQSSLGCWILAEKTGTGELIGSEDEYPYIRYELTRYNLKGEVSNTTSEALAHKLNNYDPTKYYGPSISYRTNYSIEAGVEDLLSEMRVGGYMAAVIPGWLMVSKRYSTAEEYIANCEGENVIYEFKVVEQIEDTDKWELDSIYRYLARNEKIAPSDSLKEGFYYIQDKAPSSTKAFSSDTTVYINYTGRLLNGKVFDTTIEKTGKDAGLKKTSYAPVKITWATEYDDITMGSDGTSVVDGFAYLLWQMKAYEKGHAIFWSKLGYKYSGSGNSIPAWSPLIFEVELVDAPKD